MWAVTKVPVWSKSWARWAAARAVTSPVSRSRPCATYVAITREAPRTDALTADETIAAPSPLPITSATVRTSAPSMR